MKQVLRSAAGRVAGMLVVAALAGYKIYCNTFFFGDFDSVF